MKRRFPAEGGRWSGAPARRGAILYVDDLADACIHIDEKTYPGDDWSISEPAEEHHDRRVRPAWSRLLSAMLARSVLTPRGRRTAAQIARRQPAGKTRLARRTSLRDGIRLAYQRICVTQQADE